MTTFPEDDPKTIREVGIVLRQLRRELNEIQSGIASLKHLVITGLACPVLVGLVLGWLGR